VSEPAAEPPEDPTPGAPESFAAAMAELTDLVERLESDQLDVDHLVERVARATELVQWCRARLDAAQFRVEEILVRAAEDDGTTDD
jgi:exodeoxyribonuclease VII small subunit